MNPSDLHTPSLIKCARHPDRDAVARCVVCREELCAECAHVANGKYYCPAHAPEAEAGAPTARRPGPFRPLVLILIAAAVGGVWVGLWLLRPLAGDSTKIYAEALTQQRLTAVAEGLDAFKKDMGRYPTAEEGLGALVKEPPAGGRWLGPYIASAYVKNGAVVDAAGKPLGYRLENGGHVLIAPGKDGLVGSGDDVRMILEKRTQEEPLGSGFEGLFGNRPGKI